MRKAGRLSLYGKRYTFPLLLQLGDSVQRFPMEMPGRPTLAAALALIRQPDPQRKTKKGKPGKGSPRLEKKKKVEGKDENGGGGEVW